MVHYKKSIKKKKRGSNRGNEAQKRYKKYGKQNAEVNPSIPQIMLNIV